MDEVEWTEAVGPELIEAGEGVIAPARFRISRGLPRITRGRLVGVDAPTVMAEFVVLPGGKVRRALLHIEEQEGREFPTHFAKAERLEAWALKELPALLRSDPREERKRLGDPDFAAQMLRRRDERADTASSLRGVRGRPPVSVDRIEEAAKVHRECTEGSPLAAVADHFEVSESTASRWIRAARAKGLDVGSSGSRGAGRTAGPVAVMLQEVANVVERAERYGLPIGAEVVRVQGVSIATARRRIAAARKAGLLETKDGQS